MIYKNKTIPHQPSTGPLDHLDPYTRNCIEVGMSLTLILVLLVLCYRMRRWK